MQPEKLDLCDAQLGYSEAKPQCVAQASSASTGEAVDAEGES